MLRSWRSSQIFTTQPQKKLILPEDRKRHFESNNRIATFQPYGLYFS